MIAALTWSVFRRTHAGQARVEAYHSALAEQAGDALGNIVLVQSFVRLAAEASRQPWLPDYRVQLASGASEPASVP